MSRVGQLATVVVVGAVVGTAAPARAADERALAFTFTPTERSQIAIWIESTDGTFLSTVSLTQAVSVRGIGNRPGAAQMNSGYRWPYGRREGVLPIWGQRRMSAPGAMPFPRVVFQNRNEGDASQTCGGDSTVDMYFCLSFTRESTTKENLDAITCASKNLFNSDKGRFLTAADVAAGYSEPTWVAGQPAVRQLDLTSPYPPRRDFVSCAVASTRGPCLGGNDICRDHPDTASYADVVRTVMPDIDAVTTATPPGDVEQTVMFSVPGIWPDGEYVAYLEVNTEGDYNGTFSATAYPTPCAPYGTCSFETWDNWAVDFGYPYRGQPSVVFSVPFALGPAGMFSTMTPVGFGSVDGTDANPGAMHAMDASITDDALGAPGSGADRLRMNTTFTSRLEVEVRPCLSQAPPDAPGGVTVEPVRDPKHSHEWAHLHFVVPANLAAGIARYEVRTSTDQPIVAGDASSFIRGLPAQAASMKTEALMVPVNGAPGSPVDVDFGGLNPTTHYWVGVRAVDLCNRPGPPAVAEVTTTAINYTKLSGPCFIATAAWGSALEPQVAALRRARDRLVQESGLFAAATDLYYRASPPAADALRKSETARALARRFLGPVGAAAQSVTPAR
jgi:hypothetical protein